MTIFEAVRQARAFTAPNNSIFKRTTEAPHSEITQWAMKACENLDIAREELIGDADCNMHDGSLSSGSIVTPERIMIIFMKRLSEGVFDEGYVEFIQLYQECLQWNSKLASVRTLIYFFSDPHFMRTNLIRLACIRPCICLNPSSKDHVLMEGGVDG
jgi:hypothetical protein